MLKSVSLIGKENNITSTNLSTIERDLVKKQPRTHQPLARVLKQLGIEPSAPVIVHSSLSSFGVVSGGATAIVNTLLDYFETLVVPTFTYKTMVVPEDGPTNNALAYGKTRDLNKMAEMFYPDYPSDRTIGAIPETVRKHHLAQRSQHPIFSFAGVNAEEILAAQTLTEPFAPISELMRNNGWVILMGVSHTTNTSIHWAERLAGRKFFTRWALAEDAVTECLNFPPCSEGFDSIAPHLQGIVRESSAGDCVIKAYPLINMIEIALNLIKEDPNAFLCRNYGCMRCDAVRRDLRVQIYS